MIRAFLAGGMIAVIAPAIGMFLVQRRMSFLVDTLAHVSLAGIALGLILSLNPIASAAAVAMLGALLADWLRSHGKMEGDAALVLLMYGSLGTASVLLSTVRGPALNLESLLFGSILTVSDVDLLIILLLGLLVLCVVLRFYRQLFCLVFDEEWSETIGLPVGRLNAILILLAALTVALSMRIVGVLLVGSLMIIPCIAAVKLGKGFLVTFIFSIVVSFLSVLCGVSVSYYAGWPSGGTIVLVMLLAVLLVSVHKLLHKNYRRDSEQKNKQKQGGTQK